MGKIHMMEDKEAKFLIKEDGTWNILCNTDVGSHCEGTNNWRNVTCKNCLKLHNRKEK